MATKSSNSALESVVKSVKNKDFSPVYFLFGEEPYYIDELCNFMESNILTEDEREFNQTVLYGSEVSTEDVVMTAKRFPMMAEYQVVIVKEAQQIKDLKMLESYLKNPQTSTILILCYKGKSPDKRQKVTQLLLSECVAYESALLKADRMPDWIVRYFRKRGYDIEPKAAILLGEFTGSDLIRAAMESDKLILNAKTGYVFTEKDLEKQVGLSKEYSVFEFQSALGRRDVFKANSIALYLSNNSKENPIQVVISLLYGYFSKVLQLHYIKSKGVVNPAKALGVWDSLIRDYEITAKNYTPAKLIHVIHHLRKADLQSKGFDSGSIDTEGILKELVFKIIH